ncbi:MAG: hypothetical protein KDC85_00370 [Saprospiraceae bacterium]|nr:hypothetical protein [Saprospiraceae bacterium]MCB9325427.1 hypothetical protein [Lewinellaceae bacterium]
MRDQTKLLLVKLAHTLIWIFFVTLIFYILYSGWADCINAYTWFAIGFVLLEGLVLVAFKMFCPLTLVARKYSTSEKENFDIFLPVWLARHNKVIFTTIFLAGIIWVAIRLLEKQG